MKTKFVTGLPIAAKDKLHIDFLSSGSCGNCTLLRQGKSALAIDIGLGPTVFKEALANMGITFRKGEPQLEAVFLTHTHSDHIHDNVLKVLLQNHVKLYAHVDHMNQLRNLKNFDEMREADLIRCYRETVINPFENLQILPIPLSHDSIATHGFVFHFNQGEFRFGYVADLGYMPDSVIEDLTDCDVLGLEFNHDVEMQRFSGRPMRLVNRVLGPEGHLSNEQAQEVLDKIMYRSTNRQLQQLVLLHRSTQCNRAQLAENCAKVSLDKHKEHKTTLTLAEQRQYAGTVTVSNLRWSKTKKVVF